MEFADKKASDGFLSATDAPARRDDGIEHHF